MKDLYKFAKKGCWLVGRLSLPELQRLKNLVYPLLVIEATVRQVTGYAPIGRAAARAACGVHRRTARKWLTALQELGYLQRVAHRSGYASPAAPSRR